ncbi:MAG: DUF4982 domain-containing protein [Lachnospiraceae bacterium]|nr:DUF4982 domain-containing protein [Lachnospiraceae bacterium]
MKEMTKLLNDNWEFALDNDEYSPVEIPHDWLIYDSKNLYRNGIGRYRRILNLPDLEAGQRVFLNFDGVYMDSKVYVNKALAGEWKYGYTAFEFDITDYINVKGDNTILVEINHQAPNSRWYSGAGIYRDVTLKIKNACYFLTDGIYITTFKTNGKWDYKVTAEVETQGKPYEVRHTVLEADKEFKAWDIGQANLYNLRSELIVDGEVTDITDTRFGFREIEFDTEKGFFLNGRYQKIFGVCMHHDLGALGSAVHKDAIRRQLLLLRKMGVNAIRTSHNPPAKVFMELVDEMGFLVQSEILDMWERPKTEFDYARFFHEWIERDVASWIRRDRNCPSIIMWSVGNEIYDTHASAERGGELLKYLKDLVEKHDPDHHAQVTLCSNFMPWENTQKCADIIKLIGYNYAEELYSQHHEKYPDWFIYGGETASHVQSRGIYRFPLRQSVLSDDDMQCSSLGNSTSSWGGESPEWVALTDINAPFSLGQFIWTGQDYIGEPTPYHTKNAYFGQIDTAGFPKDSFYVYKAAWNKEPMIHLYPYWDFSPGQTIDVRAATNAHRAELFLNGNSLGAVTLENRLIADWSVKYEAGELRAVAYDEEGNIIAESVRNSCGDAKELKLETEVFGELYYVAISALDALGNEVSNANNRVRINVKGGTILGMDNGDSADFDQYKTDNRRLFNGKLSAIIRRNGAEEMSVKAAFDDSEIPIRKILLTLDGFNVSAKIYPENATYDDLCWRLTDSAGIDSPLADISVSPDGKNAVILPKGDGELWTRCTTNNGGEHISLISQMSLLITGYGKPFIDPYSFVAGGLSNRSNIKLGNGNERGIVSARKGESHIGFANLDFGSFGSDELTIPIFALESQPFEFEIWEGMPGDEEAGPLSTVYYDLGTIWNTYQEITCKLPRFISGLKTLCFVFRQKVHLKGFTFTKYAKAFSRLNAACNDGISGDTFTVSGKAVIGIGNNVSIIFKDMDFGEEKTSSGASSVTLSTRSQVANNSVQILIGGRREMFEVKGEPEFTEVSYPLKERIFGKQTISIVFLPGCNIDFEWIQFSP